MRILHTSDWHLGRSFHGEGLGAAHEAYVDHLVETARTHEVDAVLVAGDIYDRALPNPRTVELLDDALWRLLDTGARVVVTSGNHDSASRLNFGSRIMEHAGLHIRASYESITRPVAIPRRGSDETAGHVVALPYLEPSVAAGVFGLDEGTHRAVLSDAVARARAQVPNDGAPVVAMAHAYFAGATTSDSERDISVGGLGQVPTSVIAPFEYAALGHLHGPQMLEENVRYSGSPVAMSFSEARHTKGSWLLDVTRGQVRGEFVEAPVHRPLAILSGTLDDLLADPDLAHAERAWCQVTLTDAVRPAAAMERLRARFPHTLRLMFDSPAEQGAPVTYAERLAGRDDVELCCDFLAHVRGGRGPSAGEHTAIGTAVAAALRRDDETMPDDGSMFELEGLA